MSGFFDFLKNLFSGIFSFFGGLIGGKKPNEISQGEQPKVRRDPKSKYFLELDEAKNLIPDSAKSVKQESEKVPQAVGATSQPASTEQSAKPKPVAVASSAIADPQPATSTQAPAKQSEPATVASALNLPQPTVTTFAPDYLQSIASSNGRRRPGANMSSYLDMARQVKPAD